MSTLLKLLAPWGREHGRCTAPNLHYSGMMKERCNFYSSCLAQAISPRCADFEGGKQGKEQGQEWGWPGRIVWQKEVGSV